MKNLFRILTILTVLIFSINTSFAIQPKKIEKEVKNASFAETSTIAVSIKNAKTGQNIFSYNEKKLLHPASTIKILTGYEALNILGADYQFKTQFYKDSKNNLYIKLAADPSLSSTQLKQAFKSLKEANNTKFANLYFDDSVLDKKEVSAGVMWDDDINYYTPKVSSYNLDNNLLRIALSDNENGTINADVKTGYKTGVFAQIKRTDSNTNLNIERYNWNNPELLEITGTVTNEKQILVPISSMRRYFIKNVENILRENKITVSNTSYSSKLVPDGATLIYEITNSMAPVIPQVFQYSNNLMAETLFKLAGGAKYYGTGTDELGIEAFKEFYAEMGLDTKGVVLRDGCGVSRNNLVTTDWLTDGLNKIYNTYNFDEFQSYLAQPGEGTLASRLYELRGDVWLKTGTLFGVSALAGYVNSLDGNTYSVSIITQNFKDNPKVVKDFEDEIIKLIYSK